jgi:hypothetical protein
MTCLPRISVGVDNVQEISWYQMRGRLRRRDLIMAQLEKYSYNGAQTHFYEVDGSF